MSYGIASSWAVPRLSMARLFERLESYLACALCSAQGPHRVYDAPAGGRIAVCELCRQRIQMEAAQAVAQQVANSLEGASHG